MESNLQRIRNHYLKVRNMTLNNHVSSLPFDDAIRYRSECQAEKQRCTQQNDLAGLNEARFYSNKFTRLQTLLSDHKKESASCMGKEPKGLNAAARKLFEEEYVAAAVPADKQGVSDFFDKKKSMLGPQPQFASSLETPPTTTRNFRKKIAGGRQELRRLQEENQELRERLVRGEFSSQERSRYEEESRRQSQRISELETQNQHLQAMCSQGSSVSSTLRSEDALHAPYVLNPLENDLYKLNAKNESEAAYSRYGGSDDYVDLNGRPDSHSQQGNYSVFEATKSYYTEVDENSSRSYGIDDQATATRNKKAFVRPEGIIVKNDEFEIGYKRSDSGGRHQKIILYFYNKSGRQKGIRCEYVFETTHYRLKVRERLSYISGNKQGREVVEVQFLGELHDSVIEMEVHVDDVLYKLWLPAMFLHFGNQPAQEADRRGSYRDQKMTVTANKNYQSAEEARRMIPQIRASDGEGELYPKEGGTIRMQWKSRNRVEVTAAEKYLHMMAFILSEQRS